MADKGGLEGVVVARSRLCSIDGQNGVLIYGGYDVNDLADHSSYEEACFLILRGRLPCATSWTAFTAELAAARTLSGETASVIDMLASHAAPMEMLRTAVSADSFDDPDKDSNDREANVRKATRLIAKMPTMVARYDRRRRGPSRSRPTPRSATPRTSSYMLSGERAGRPGGAHVRRRADPARRPRDERLDVHGPRDRSTLSDMHSAITGAIGALKGPLHGGANEQVMHC